MPINAGDLDQRLTIRQRAAGVDARGQANGAWQTVATVWGKSMPGLGREFAAAAGLQSSYPTVFRIRRRTDITHAMQVLWRGVPYDVEAAVPSVGVEGTDLVCVQGVRDGD